MLRRLRKKYAYSLGILRNIRPARHVPIAMNRESGGTLIGVDKKYRLTICAIMHNEANYLAEWIMFHYQRNVDHFILYDNDSNDDPHSVLEPWISRGVVELFPWPNFLSGANAQHLCYAHACRYLSGKTRWLSFLDLDEFLFPVEGSSLPEVLEDYDEFSAVGVFLRCFGPNGHYAPPNGFVIENYTTRLSDEEWENRQYKSIVKPEMVSAIISAQRCELIGQDCPAYDENRRPLYTSTNHSHTSTKLRINHYATRSLAEFERKLNRRYFWSNKNDENKRLRKLNQHSNLLECKIKDEEILRFIPELRKEFAAKS